MGLPATGIRARNRAAIEGEILASARRQLARTGAAALSLRAVAREMGMTTIKVVDPKRALAELESVLGFDVGL